MARKTKLPGLIQRKDGIWVLDKIIPDYGRIYRSTRTHDYAEAEKRARTWIKEAEDGVIYGKPTRITFREAAAMYVKRVKKKSMASDINDLKKVMPFIGNHYIDQIHAQTL